MILHAAWNHCQHQVKCFWNAHSYHQITPRSSYTIKNGFKYYENGCECNNGVTDKLILYFIVLCLSMSYNFLHIYDITLFNLIVWQSRWKKVPQTVNLSRLVYDVFPCSCGPHLNKFALLFILQVGITHFNPLLLPILHNDMVACMLKIDYPNNTCTQMFIWNSGCTWKYRLGRIRSACIWYAQHFSFYSMLRQFSSKRDGYLVDQMLVIISLHILSHDFPISFQRFYMTRRFIFVHVYLCCTIVVAVKTRSWQISCNKCTKINLCTSTSHAWVILSKLYVWNTHHNTSFCLQYLSSNSLVEKIAKHPQESV